MGLGLAITLFGGALGPRATKKYLKQFSICTLSPSRHTNKDALKKAIKAVKFQTGLTYTAKGMTTALKRFDLHDRNDAKKVGK